LITPDTGLDEVITETDTKTNVERTALSLLDALAAIPDPRAARGVRHGVLAVLLVSACAVLAGARSFVAIAEYAHDTGQVVLDLLGIGARVPHESTIRRLLQQLDPAAVEDALSMWAGAQLAARAVEAGIPARERRRVWALDGKTVRGARTSTEPAPTGRCIWCRSWTRPAASCWPRWPSTPAAESWPRSPAYSPGSTCTKSCSPPTHCTPSAPTPGTCTNAVGTT
jgi:hypothetical protein